MWPMHWHPAYVAYVFNDGTATVILADRREIPLARRTPIHNLIVELRK